MPPHAAAEEALIPCACGLCARWHSALCAPVSACKGAAPIVRLSDFARPKDMFNHRGYHISSHVSITYIIYPSNCANCSEWEINDCGIDKRDIAHWTLPMLRWWVAGILGRNWLNKTLLVVVWAFLLVSHLEGMILLPRCILTSKGHLRSQYTEGARNWRENLGGQCSWLAGYPLTQWIYMWCNNIDYRLLSISIQSYTWKRLTALGLDDRFPARVQRHRPATGGETVYRTRICQTCPTRHAQLAQKGSTRKVPAAQWCVSDGLSILVTHVDTFTHPPFTFQRVLVSEPSGGLTCAAELLPQLSTNLWQHPKWWHQLDHWTTAIGSCVGWCLPGT